MSATTTSTPEGQSPVVAAPAATPAAPAPVDIKSIDLSKLDGATLAAALATASSQPEGQAPAAAPDGYTPPADTPAPVVTTPPAATPAAEPAKPAEAPAAVQPEDDNPQPEKLGKFRVSARDFKEAEFLRLAKTMPVPEAYAKAYGAPAPVAPAATPSAAPAQPETALAAPVEAPELVAAKSTLATLETQLAKAQEDADLGAVTKIMRDIGKAERAVERIEQQAEAQRQAAQQSKAQEADNTFRQREAAVIQDVKAKFPQLGDKASEAEFQQFVNIKYDDPEYAAIFTSPRRFEVLAREFAEAKGWNKAPAPAPAAGTTPAPTPGAPAAQRVTQAEVLTPGSTQGGSGAIDAQSALAALRAQGPEALFKALNSVSRQ